MIVWDRPRWLELRSGHLDRAHHLVDAVLVRRRAGRRHPVEDFLFDYYPLRPGQLLAWHPGPGVGLADAPEYADQRFYSVDAHGVTSLDLPGFVARRARTISEAGELERAVAGRPARFGCFGMHEWAMVYGLTPDQTRHSYLPLRFAPDEVRRVVDEVGVRCSHYDAFRFFTDQARPLNSFQPTRATQSAFDQPGCLHANMDLYKWAGKLLPAIDSGLLLDTFELARDIRTLDMQASAYDLTSWGYPPVPVETPGGRAAYVSAQRGFSVRAHVLRQRLLQILAILGAERSSTDLVDSDGQGRT